MRSQPLQAFNVFNDTDSKEWLSYSVLIKPLIHTLNMRGQFHDVIWYVYLNEVVDSCYNLTAVGLCNILLKDLTTLLLQSGTYLGRK